MTTARRSATVTASVLAALVGGLLVAPAGAADPVDLDQLSESVREHAEDVLHEHSDAVSEAAEALEAAERERAEAEDNLEAAEAEAEDAHAQVASLRAALAELRRAQRAAEREGSAIAERFGDGTLGALAAAAYETTREVAEREVLRYLRDELGLAEAEAEAADEAVAEADDAMTAARRAYDDAEAELEKLRAAELAEYQQFMAESEALEEWLAEYGSAETIEGTGSFVRPATGRLTSPYGPRFHPILRYTRMHTGIDLGIGDGFIYAADHGVVVEATWSDGYGYFVVIDHGVIDGQRVSTLYAHQPGLSVDIGDVVAKGQPIGSIGSTGLSTGPHLHFEVRIDGRPVDPAGWLADAPMPESPG